MSQQSFHQQTANGSNIAFTITTFSVDEIKVYVDGVESTNGGSSQNDYTIPNYTTSGGTVTWNTSGSLTAPASPSVVRIVRQTDVMNNGNTAVEGRATYTPGSSVKADDLNNNTKQALRAIKENQEQLIQSYDFEPQAVNTAAIKDLNVTRGKLEADIIDGTKLADDSVDSEHIVADSIDTEHYAPSSVDTNAIADNAVTLAKLGGGALPTDITVSSTNIVNGTIVNADVNGSAAIDGTKVDPAFGSQNLSTSGTAATGNLTVTGTISVSSTVDGRDVAADGTKLDGIETAATADQTDEEIQDIVGGMLSGNTESGITVTYQDSDGTIDFSVASQTDQNFTNADHSKLDGIEAGATADQTASEIKTLLQSDKLELSEMNTTSLDTRYFTETESDARYFRQDSSETIASGDTWSSSDAFVATTGAINARIVDLIDDVGGFTAITSEQHFPNTNPQGSTGQAAILSIQAASTTLTPSGTTVTISNGNLADNANITITGVTAAIPTGFGFLVESTSTLHTYTFHRLVPKATEVTTVATNITNIVNAGANVVDINNFADLYQISNSAPTQRADGTSLQEGDLWYDSSNDNLLVYTGSAFAIITPSQSVLDDVAIVSGAITYSEDLGLITNAASTGSSNGSLDIVADAIEDEITFTVTAATGKFIIDGVDKPALTLYKGWTYTFDVSDASNASHPLRFSSGGSAYSTGVTVTGTQGQAGAKVQLVVPESQPTSFIYYCTNHSGMGNSITVKDDPIKTVSDNVTSIVAVANNSTNINAVNSNSSNINSAVSNASNINSAVSNASNINSVVSNATNINTVAGAISNVNSVGSNISNVNSVHSNATNINSAVSNASNINSVAGSISNVNTVASNLSNVNSFAGTYQIASSAPSTDGAGNALAAGDLYFDTTANELRVHNGSTFQGGVTATGNLAGLGANTFTGAQTINSNIIVSGTVDGRDVATDGTKLDGIEANATADQTASEIVSLISGQTIAPNVITTTNLTLDFGSIA
tara:strand:+ start:6506 stop:9517 length:3012 start_codon:yes stop_codon:yes gene_type:complete